MRKLPIETRGLNLFLEVYLIGYKNSGESIVLFVKNELREALWCGVIDCYTYKNHNKTRKLLMENGYGNKKIDFICISHPYIDHVKSISNIINEFTSDKTMFLMPNFSDSKIVQTKEIKRINASLKSVFKNSYTRTKVINNLFYNQKIGITDLKWQFIVGTKTINLQLESLTPFDSTMQNSTNVPYQQFKNDFSICLKLTLNDFQYLFMGDCTDIVLNELDEDYIPDELNYLKIPHHGCKSAMMEYYVNNIIKKIEVTGCAYRKHTTLKDTLEFYKRNCDQVSITASIDPEKNVYAYGVVRHVYDIKSGYLIKSDCLGNAVLNY